MGPRRQKESRNYEQSRNAKTTETKTAETTKDIETTETTEAATTTETVKRPKPKQQKRTTDMTKKKKYVVDGGFRSKPSQELFIQSGRFLPNACSRYSCVFLPNATTKYLFCVQV